MLGGHSNETFSSGLLWVVHHVVLLQRNVTVADVGEHLGGSDQISGARAVRRVVTLTHGGSLHVSSAADARTVVIVVLGSGVSTWFHLVDD